MPFKNNIVFITYSRLKKNLPDFVIATIWKLSPLYLIAALLEIFGLMTIFPVISILLKPEIIETNRFLHLAYTSLPFESHFAFALFSLAFITVIFILKNIFFMYISDRQFKKAYEIAARLADYKYQDYLSRSYLFHLNNSSAVLLRNIASLPFELVTHILLSFISLINEIFIMGLIIVIIFIYQPVLFLSLLVFAIPVFVLYEKLFKKAFTEFSVRRDTESITIFRHTLQSIEGFREIKLFNKLSFFKPIFQKAIQKYCHTARRFYLLNFISPKFIETIAVMSVMAIVLAGFLLGNNLQSLSEFLIVFSIAAYRIIPSANKIILNVNNIKASEYVFNYFQNIKEVPGDAPAGSPSPAAGNAPLDFEKEISVRALSFRFPGQPDYVLKNISFKIEKGSTIGIVGSSGSGKTTLLNILLRLFKETEGGVYVDNRKLNDDNVIGWYRLISYVPQNTIILDGTIIENIAFGIPPSEVDHALLKKVISQSQLDSFIEGLPEGIYTEIGEKGLKISGGQRQRLSIARALYHGGKILIFDEATSALDSSTEELITESIFNLKNKDYTTIIVAHRLSTLKHCDRIFRLSEGVLTEEKNKDISV